MSQAHQIAGFLNWAVVVALVGIGVDFLRSKQVKPHHAQILAVPLESLPIGAQKLILMFMKGTGLVAIVTAVSMSILLREPFARQEAWSRTALLVVAGVALIPTLLVTFQVRATTGAKAPWWPHVVMLAALGTAFYLTRDFH